MGVDCRVTLPPGARLDDVADVIGRALGCDGEVLPLDHEGAVCAIVHGVRTEVAPGQPMCAYAVIDPPDGRGDRFLYHHEWNEHAPGTTGLSLASNGRGIALARRLVDFFGGWVDDSDHDDTDVDYERPPREPIAPTDGAAWDDFQRALVAVAPLTPAEIRDCERFGARSGGTNWRR